MASCRLTLDLAARLSHGFVAVPLGVILALGGLLALTALAALLRMAHTRSRR